MTTEPLPDLSGTSVAVHLSDRYEVDENGCWLWTGYIDHQGYGHIRRHPLERRAHRAFYADVHGPIPPGQHIHHRCEVKRCVNPAHLEALTPTSHLRGHWHEYVELDDQIRASIREAAQDRTVTLREIAERFGVPRPTVNKIVQGYSWFDGERVEVPPRTCALDGCNASVTGRRHKRFCTPEHQKEFNNRKARAR